MLVKQEFCPVFLKNKLRLSVSKTRILSSVFEKEVEIDKNAVQCSLKTN